MPRQNFISDKLLDMGDRLKRNYAEANGQELPAEKPVRPAPSAGEGDAESARIGRELAEHIVRDQAKVAAGLEECELRHKELVRFQTVLNELAAAQAEQSAQGDRRRELEQLRIKYFAAAGRVDAVAGAGATVMPARVDASYQPHAEWRRYLPVAIAVALGALLVAAAILIAFR
ncbi:MAG: hypothetical protein PHI35_03220 [Victivallaceae bacterium]|nr:hypothetical protein [Victivallaceae bacterium]